MQHDLTMHLNTCMMGCCWLAVMIATGNRHAWHTKLAGRACSAIANFTSSTHASQTAQQVNRPYQQINLVEIHNTGIEHVDKVVLS